MHKKFFITFLALLFTHPAFAADVPAEYNRVAKWWHQETGVAPRYDIVALTSQTYASAVEIDRAQIMKTMMDRMRADVDSLDVSDDVYVIRIRTQLSEYDPREGGFFASLFSGASFIPIQSPNLSAEPDKGFAGGALGDGYELHFLNAPDFYFYPASEDQGRSLMQQGGRNPNVIIEFRLQPIAAEMAPPGAESRRIYGRVIEAKIELNKAIVFTRSVAPVAPADMAAARKETLAVIRNPDDLTMAMMWHKIVDGPEPDWAQLVAGDRYLQRADVFARDEVEQSLIAQSKAYYDRLDPETPFRFTVNANVGPYDVAAQKFPIELGGTVVYRHMFPFKYYADDAERAAIISQTGPGFALPVSAFTEFRLAFDNGTELEGFHADQETARAIGLNLQGQAEVAVRSMRAETWESRDRRKADKYLVTRIEGLRVTDPTSGKLLYETTLEPYRGPIEVTQHKPEAEGFEGVEPYSVEIRGLKLGMSEAEFMAAAKSTFGAVGPDKESPAKLRYRGDNNERGYVILDQDRNVKAISYVRSWKGEQTQPVYEATIKKYGVPGAGFLPRNDPRKMRDMEAEMKWTTNAARVGGFTGRVWYWDYQKETTLYLDLEDRRKANFEPPKPTISLE
ncbi:MAG: hypothetical protein GC184_08200 [Rhizobiales bacterium]|nr:hypothetical protein [Hyphomicrobiales bacterium]